MKTNINKLFIYLSLALVAGLCFSCNDEGADEIEEGKTIIHGTIGTRAANNDPYYKDPEGNLEIINTWWIVFVNENGNVVSIVDRSSLNTGAVSKEDFTLKLDNGTYTVYSFANISKEKVEELAAGDITVGSKMPDLSEVKFPISDLIPNGTLVNNMSIPVPMTGQETYVARGGNVDKDFEVIRLVAKVKFEFRNSCKNVDVTLKDLSFGPTNTGDVLLMPDYETLGFGENINVKDPVVPDGTATQTLTFNFENKQSPVAGTYPILEKESYSTAEPYTNFFYMRESVATTHPTKHFSIKVHINRDDKPEELLYAVTDKEFTGINRNDYVYIPINFTDYFVDLNVEFYPPIGGYPAEITKKEQEEFYCTFGTGGSFSIVPVVKDASEDTDLHPSKFSYQIMEINDPDELFVPVTPSMVGKAPYIDGSGEIVGALSPEKQGTASIKIQVSVNIGGGMSQIYNRTVYIIRKNKL